MFNTIDALAFVDTKAKLETRNGNVTKVLHQAELEEQAALIEWADKTVIDGIKIGDYLLRIPNEGKRRPKAARDAKRLGVRAGVPDLFLALPHGGYSGLWIEMKAKGGKLSAQQEVWLKRLEDAGCRAVCCFGFNQASSAISEYIKRGNENVPY
ncbi:VRR-NUC domain-containing protein [Pectobacterium brasiliense]|uniref:VRR-NUC domain-containing protein n=1 Tax=Pectobacterium brasiliense TaxID=180957 RepID=UPI002A820B10|nr:VRR-NUC domain-containing protein [Pectobacterium brasiliense]MDY4380922.1 VRR-NUC domain-containing protein [Pectobacterium brasiliense]